MRALPVMPVCVVVVALAVGCSGGGSGGATKTSSSSGTGAGSGTGTGTGSGTTTGGKTGSGSSSTTTGGFTGTTPPKVSIGAPAHAAYLTQSPVTVQGNAAAAPGGGAIASVLLNGAAATVAANGDFQLSVALVPGVNTIIAEATDQAGNAARDIVSVMFGEFRAATDAIPTGAGTRVLEGTLNHIAPAVAQAVYASGTIQQMLTAVPLYTGTQTAFGMTLASIQIDVLSVSFNVPTLAFKCAQGGMSVTVHVPNLVVVANAHGDVAGIPYSITGDIASTDAEIDMGLDIALGANGAYQITASSASVTLNGFSFGINGIPSFFTNLAAGFAQTEIQNRMADALKQDVPPAIASELGKLAQPISRTFLGYTVTMRATPETLAFDPQGFTVAFTTDVTAAKNPAIPAVPGSLFRPPPAGVLPAFGNVAGVYATVNENLMNRVLFSTWQAGFWDLTIDQQFIQQVMPNLAGSLNNGVLGQFFPQIAAMLTSYTSQFPLTLELEPLMQPVLLVTGQPDLFQLQLGELHLKLMVDLGGGPIQIFEVALHVDADVNVTIVNNALAFGIGQTTHVEAELVSSAIPFSGIDIGRFISFLMPQALQLVAHSIQPVPLPTFQGFGLVHGAVAQDGSQGEFVTVSGDVQ